MTLKAAIIGAGHIARQHLACLRELPGVQIAGVCDLSRAMAESAADRYGVANWYLYDRQPREAERLFRRVLAGGQWAAFGYIAAEADLARAHGGTR